MRIPPGPRPASTAVPDRVHLAREESSTERREVRRGSSRAVRGWGGGAKRRFSRLPHLTSVPHLPCRRRLRLRKWEAQRNGEYGGPGHASQPRTGRTQPDIAGAKEEYRVRWVSSCKRMGAWGTPKRREASETQSKQRRTDGRAPVPVRTLFPFRASAIPLPAQSTPKLGARSAARRWVCNVPGGFAWAYPIRGSTSGLHHQLRGRRI
ncbi:hypothetical protein DFH07DRAFT_841281 [Mycena maculata]|uniref:Uncharacterized protein n=1 Tax=Mycena maculata TaxID=230809 RepID=A0AAD7I9J0_9AGAR|nr:hypothetical protein DFH07DRAFT_841281 [Mycena maculata]